MGSKTRPIDKLTECRPQGFEVRLLEGIRHFMEAVKNSPSVPTMTSYDEGNPAGAQPLVR